MSHSYHSIAFTAPVMDSQVRYGSRAAMVRTDHTDGMDPDLDSMRDPLGSAEREFIAEQDSFYLATTSVSGWPYVQFRGGPPGFVTSLDEHTLAWADLRGNRQYISTGNLPRPARGHDLPRLPQARRLKVFGSRGSRRTRRRTVQVILQRPCVPSDRRARGPRRGYRLRLELSPTHHPRYTVRRTEPVVDPLRSRVSELEAENQLLRSRLESPSSSPEAPPPRSP